jgi:hypothetical protein
MFGFERRQHLRVPVDEIVEIRRQSGTYVPARAENLSTTGLSLRVDADLHHGEILWLHLPFLGEQAPELRARVRYAIALTGERALRVGLEFVSPGSRQSAIINAFLNARLPQATRRGWLRLG